MEANAGVFPLNGDKREWLEEYDEMLPASSFLMFTIHPNANSRCICLAWKQ